MTGHSVAAAAESLLKSSLHPLTTNQRPIHLLPINRSIWCPGDFRKSWPLASSLHLSSHLFIYPHLHTDTCITSDTNGHKPNLMTTNTDESGRRWGKEDIHKWTHEKIREKKHITFHTNTDRTKCKWTINQRAQLITIEITIKPDTLTFSSLFHVLFSFLLVPGILAPKWIFPIWHFSLIRLSLDKNWRKINN